MTVDATFTRVCPAADVPPGKVVAAEVNGTPIALVHCDDGAIRAVVRRVLARPDRALRGEVDGCTLECWLHGSRFDLRTGQPTGLPATEPVPVYPVEIHDGDVYVSLVPSNGVNVP